MGKRRNGEGGSLHGRAFEEPALIGSWVMKYSPVPATPLTAFSELARFLENSWDMDVSPHPTNDKCSFKIKHPNHRVELTAPKACGEVRNKRSSTRTHEYVGSSSGEAAESAQSWSSSMTTLLHRLPTSITRVTSSTAFLLEMGPGWKARQTDTNAS